MNKHIHGGKIFVAAKDLKVPWTKIVDFSANINPLGQPKGLRQHLLSTFAETVHYPEIAAASLVKAISKSTGLAEKAIFPGAGSTPHIRMLARALRNEKVVIIGPAFAEYEESLVAAGNTPEYVLTRPDKRFLVDTDVAKKAVEASPAAIFVANPANPTGRLVQTEALELLVEESAKRGFYLIVDEAFIDFTTGDSLEKRVLKHKKLIVLRSLTKIYAIPGLRLAYLAAHPDLVKEYRAAAEPWPINSMAMEAGLHCVPQKKYREETLMAIFGLREKLLKVLSLAGDVFPTDANFALLKLRPGRSSEDFLYHLYERRILARDASNFKGLAQGYLRFAVRPSGETAKLRTALKEYYA